MKKIFKKIIPALLVFALIFTVAAVNKTGSVEAQSKDYNCTDAKLQQLINKWDGVYWTGSFRTAVTCKGFADMMFHELYGNGGVGAYNSGRYSYYVPTPRCAKELARNSSAGYQDFYEIMHKAVSGDYIQWATAYSQHSSIFVSCDEKGFYVFDSNYVSPYKCAVHYITYEYAANVTRGVSLYRSTSSAAYLESIKPKPLPFGFAEKSVELSYMETFTPTVNGDKKVTSWTSSDDSVAVVSPEGVIEGVSGGTAIITATNSEGKTTQMTVTVKDTSVSRVIGVLLGGFKSLDMSTLIG